MPVRLGKRQTGSLVLYRFYYYSTAGLYYALLLATEHTEQQGIVQRHWNEASKAKLCRRLEMMSM
jgi:hypothetical protein